jgi:hypothetical protein
LIYLDTIWIVITSLARKVTADDMLGDDPLAEREQFFQLGNSIFRLAMSCLYECAKRIARFPSDEAPYYPSEIFLMKRLPDLNAPIVDRETTVEDCEFVHVLPVGREEWREHLSGEENECACMV